MRFGKGGLVLYCSMRGACRSPKDQNSAAQATSRHVLGCAKARAALVFSPLVCHVWNGRGQADDGGCGTWNLGSWHHRRKSGLMTDLAMPKAQDQVRRIRGPAEDATDIEAAVWASSGAPSDFSTWTTNVGHSSSLGGLRSKETCLRRSESRMASWASISGGPEPSPLPFSPVFRWSRGESRDGRAVSTSAVPQLRRGHMQGYYKA